MSLKVDSINSQAKRPMCHKEFIFFGSVFIPLQLYPKQTHNYSRNSVVSTSNVASMKIHLFKCFYYPRGAGAFSYAVSDSTLLYLSKFTTKFRFD